MREVATQRRFVCRHARREHDPVMGDDRCTLHRATSFDKTKYCCRLHRTTVAGVAP